MRVKVIDINPGKNPAILNNCARYAREDGREETMLDNIRALAETMNLTADQVMDALKVPEADRESIRKRLVGGNGE